jgi:hypothetical protein
MLSRGRYKNTNFYFKQMVQLNTYEGVIQIGKYSKHITTFVDTIGTQQRRKVCGHGRHQRLPWRARPGAIKGLVGWPAASAGYVERWWAGGCSAHGGSGILFGPRKSKPRARNSGQ